MLMLPFPLNVFIFAVPFVVLLRVAHQKGWIVEEDIPQDDDEFMDSHIDDDNRYEPGTEAYFIHR